jgi:hypothetical protein
MSQSPRHPYLGLPDRQFWRNEPGIADPAAFDPVSDVPFQISRADRVVTAGSCFAQHLARHLAQAGFYHFQTEPAHPLFDDALAHRFGYGLFSARYGNLYTPRQLLQLLHRAYGMFTPLQSAWPRGPHPRVVDPFRPQIQPEGFTSEAELVADRATHFAAIRAAVEQMQVFVFTLGLTEAWEDPRDGAIFPLAPGVAGGVYDPETVRFRNFDEAETAADLTEALTFIRSKNPQVRIVLTVSPVPLNATYEDRHVYLSTTLSKAMLRLAAERVAAGFDACCYFPSYEIITAPHTRGRYFAEDCREVLPAGVDHVMGLFFRHFAKDAGVAPETSTGAARENLAAHLEEVEAAIDLLCDEQAITNR